MKSYLIRPAGALVLALALASCGGGDDDKFTVQGTVIGLKYSGLVLQNNGSQDLTVNPPASGDTVSFSFPNKIEYGDVYTVSIKSQPLHQTCGAAREAPLSLSDTAGRLSSINAIISCALNEKPVGGTITGLTKDTTGLVLANGSNTGTYSPTLEAITADKPFLYSLPVQVAYGVTYSVTVITQPVGRFCTVQNAAGTMGDAEITNVNVNCVPR
ncbi:hypothetical protein LQ564_00625 [Massilia sp. G4R7]|uniref:Lipoprotein n=1 Tax=Massilia phyllostachyos TaxID=2898585 RepID=A0ABS8PZ83_9BURK|nr:hypothetical protein [Massilia phyllostachyos]MCD2514814.1 hypothetical protein [Massilia phyllostachyos]